MLEQIFGSPFQRATREGGTANAGKNATHFKAYAKKVLVKQLERCLWMMVMKFSYSDSKQGLIVFGRVRPILLSTLSVTEVKAFEKNSATVNSVFS